MSVKQAVRVQKGRWAIEKKKAFKDKSFKHIVCALLGFFFSLAGFNKSFSPFAIAFASSVSGRFSLSACIGSVFGWVITLDSVAALRYMSAILAVCVIKNALKAFPKIYESCAEAVGVSFGCTFITGLAIAFAEGITLYTLLFAFAESAVAGISGLLFFKIKSAAGLKGGINNFSSNEVTCICISIMLLLLGLSELSLFNVYPANILCGVLVLLCGYYNRESGGAISGACAGITMSLGGGEPHLLGLFSFGGLVCGVFSQFGKIASVIAYILAGSVVLAMNSGSLNLPGVIIEIIATAVIFFVVTHFWDEILKKTLKPSSVLYVRENVKSDVLKRLKNASEISTEICTSLTEVNDALSKSTKGNITTIQQKTKERVCGSCGLYDICWGENLSETQDSFNTLVNLKKEGVFLEYKTVPVHFSARCIRTENVASSFNKLYEEYKIRKKTEGRLKEMHNLASEQFINVSALLDSLCDKLSSETTYDAQLSSRIISSAYACGFQASECTCAIGSYGKMVIELKIKSGKNNVDISELSNRINMLSGRRFELPLIERKEHYKIITYKEKAEFKVISSGVQYCADDEKYSGDTFATFEDDNGMFYAVVCDGMGTGAKAALSSGLAVMLLEKLIKAGFGIKAAVNTVNTSLISKSGDECSVTLDLAVVDLYTGFTQFYKSGAADTILRKGNKILNINIPSLPLGILSNTEIGCSTGTLSSGDSFVMFSDGVLEEDKMILKKSLKSFTGDKVKSFTTENAKKIRESQKSKRDDMTILTIAIKEND